MSCLARLAAARMQSDGFELARQAVPRSVCAEVRAMALQWATVHAWRGWLGLGSSVRAPRHRAHVPLALTPPVDATLRAATHALAGAFERAGVSRDETPDSGWQRSSSRSEKGWQRSSSPGLSPGLERT